MLLKSYFTNPLDVSPIYFIIKVLYKFKNFFIKTFSMINENEILVFSINYDFANEAVFLFFFH